MANIVVLGAGVAGHTAAAYLQKGLNKKEHKITVISLLQPINGFHPIFGWVWVE
jgi:glycine/D-amino acid oxidase-like deaminating enzyme